MFLDNKEHLNNAGKIDFKFTWKEKDLTDIPSNVYKIAERL